MAMALKVLYDDLDHCVVLKPAGMATHGRGPQTLVSVLQELVRLGAVSPSEALLPVHRLDFGTRGPLVLAKHLDAHRTLQAQWPDFSKIYHAWVAGRLRTSRGQAAMPLDGKNSVTSFRNLGSRPWGIHGEATLVEWNLQTGRTHQIRRHAAALGHPVVGDPVYGPPPLYRGHGMHLTCSFLAWQHPTTGALLQLTVPPAKKMKRAVLGTFEPGEPSPMLELFVPH
jgi:23S rRNA pseudouridine1911/1915/1917 synthase